MNLTNGKRAQSDSKIYYKHRVVVNLANISYTLKPL